MTDPVSLNGELIASDDARLSVFDAGLSHGAGLFETVRAYAGAPFRLPQHIARMRRSAHKFSFAMPWDDAELERTVRHVLSANRLAEARVRITLTPGNLRRLRDDAAGEPTLLVAAQAFEAYPVEYYQRGMTVCISSYRQSKYDPTAGHKTLSYFPRLLALREAQRKQCGEALWFTTDNQLAEGSVSNVFVVRGDALLTPPVETPVLPGIARGAVLEMAMQQRLTLEQRPLTIDDLLAADEVFLCNTVMEVMPVCRVERHAVGDEKVGETTRRLHEAYRDLVWKECRIGGVEP